MCKSLSIYPIYMRVHEEARARKSEVSSLKYVYKRRRKALLRSSAAEDRALSLRAASVSRVSRDYLDFFYC